MSKSIGNILEELSTRSGVISTEIDDFSNPMHIVRLKEVLNEYDISYEVIDDA